MKIIIDIPEYMYDWFDTGFLDDDDFEKLWKIIKDGQIIETSRRKRKARKKNEDCN